MRPLGIPEFREMWEECLIEGRSVSDTAPGNSGIPGNVGRVFDRGPSCVICGPLGDPDFREMWEECLIETLRNTFVMGTPYNAYKNYKNIDNLSYFPLLSTKTQKI